MDMLDLDDVGDEEQMQSAFSLIRGDAQASTSANTLEGGNEQRRRERSATPRSSPWAAGKDGVIATLADAPTASSALVTDASSKESQQDVPTAAMANMEMDNPHHSSQEGRATPEVYDGPVPGADAPFTFNEAPDWPSVSSIHIPVGRNTFVESDDEDGTDQINLNQGEGLISPKPEPFRSGLLYSSVMMLHAIPAYTDPSKREQHPEQPDRIRRIFEMLQEQGLARRMKRIKIREATRQEIMLVHDRSVWDGVQRTAFFTHESLSAQTHLLEQSSLYINQHSALCARLSCGGVIEMCDAVAKGEVRNGFAIVRPPGHHAEPEQPMGFCLYNNVAVAACYLRERYGHLEGKMRCKRILILDWDVHHGNGTQAQFYDDENVLYISIHRYENGSFFPAGKAGDHDQVGSGAARGRNVNIPWPDKGMTDGDYIAAFSRIVMPIAQEFAPDFVIVSAGFDAAKGDDLGECEVTPKGYAHMTYDLASLADGRLVVALEGGYNLEAIANSALSVTEVLLGEAPASMPRGIMCSGKADDTFRLVQQSQSPFWKCMETPYEELRTDEDDDIAAVDIGQLIAQYRAKEVAEKYGLAVLPITAPAGSEFAQHALVSADLLSRPRQTLVVFVHDMGNIRVEPLSGLEFDGSQELYTFLDGSSRVLDWARDNDVSIVDICLHFQLPTRPRVPYSRGQRRTHARDVPYFDEACKHLGQIWDSYINLAMTRREVSAPGQQVDIVLIGLGTACAAVMDLISQRRPLINKSVRAIIQLPCHSTIPTFPKNDPELRKWYFNHAMAILPFNHAYYTYDAQAQAGKRLGQVFRSKHSRAIHVLQTEFTRIEAFIAQHVPRLAAKTRKFTNGLAPNRSAANGINGSPASNAIVVD